MHRGPLTRPLRPLICALLLARQVAAEAESPRDPGGAEALFAEAQVLMERGDYATACPKLEESFRLDPATGALFALALCHEQQGRYASAYVELMDVAARANAENNPRREEDARLRAEALYARLSFLEVRVNAATAALPNLVVTRDGVRLGSPAWGTAIPIDPGQHVIEARAPGYESWKGTIALGAEPRKEIVTIPPLVRSAPARPRRHEAPDAFRSDRPGLELTPLRLTGIALGSGAVAAFGVSAYATLRALDKYEDSKEDCNSENDCGIEGDRDRTSAREAANIATIGAVAGGALLASGVVLFLLGRPDTGKTTLKARASLTGCEIRGTF